MKRITTFLLVFVLLVNLFPAWAMTAEAAAGDDLEAIVEKQILAFANSIARQNSHENAGMLIANHAITDRGAPLHAGQNHILTSCTYTSELTKAALTHLCTSMIQTMQELDMTSMFGKGGINWRSYTSTYSMTKYPDSNARPAETLGSATSKGRYGIDGFPGPLNDQDTTMLWVAGSASMTIEMRQTAVSADEITYSVKVCIGDRFNFDGDYSQAKGDATFEKVMTILGSTMGKLLFREFDWDSTVEFSLSVPNTCSHSSGNYHWIYDADRNCLVADNSGNFMTNTATPILYSSTNSNTGVTTSYYYHKLDDTVYLMHDKPWIIEYTTKKPGNIAFNATGTSTCPLPILMQQGSTLFYASLYERVKLTEAEKNALGLSSTTSYYRHYYATPLKDLFKYSNKYTYTFHLENVIHADGSNMIYLTVYNNDLQETVLESAALNDYYRQAPGEKSKSDQGVESNWVSGKDFMINYIGAKGYKLAPETFDLTIMPNGQGVASDDAFTKTVTSPTCTSSGYTTNTCRWCGFSYQASYTSPVAHHYENGVCTGCGDFSASFRGASLSLNGMIDVNFYAKIGEGADAKVVFEINGQTKEMHISQATIKDGLYVFPCQVAAKQMADEIKAQIYINGQPAGEPATYSVQQYCENKLTSVGTTDRLKDLLIAMLNYGTEAQRYFGYNTHNLANDILSDAQKVLTPVTADQLNAFTMSISGSDAGIVKYGASLLLESATVIRYRIQLADGYSINQYTFQYGNQTLTPVDAGNQIYYVDITGIAAKDLDEMYPITIGNLSIHYGPMSYILRQLDNPTAVPVVTSLYHYNNMANIYFA